MSDSDYLKKLELKYEELFHRDPKTNSFVLLAEVLIKRKKFDRAVKVLVNGLMHNKHNVTARFLLGKIYYERWMIDQAKKEFEKIINLAPDNLAVAKILIEIYKSEKDFDRALGIAKRLSYYYSESEEIQTIIKELKHIVDRNNTSVSIDSSNELKTDENITPVDTDLISETLADLYCKQGHYSESIEIYNKILDTNPSNIKVVEKIRQVEKMSSSEDNSYK